MKKLGCVEKQEVGRWANNRAENAHMSFRRRERAMLRFRRMKSLQKFASVHGSIHNHFNEERPLVDYQTYRERRSAGQVEWQSLANCPLPLGLMRLLETGSHWTDRSISCAARWSGSFEKRDETLRGARLETGIGVQRCSEEREYIGSRWPIRSDWPARM